MKEAEIKRLIKILEQSSVGELEVRRWGRSIRISKYASKAPDAVNSRSDPSEQVSASSPPPAAVAAPAAKASEPVAGTQGNFVEQKSPMVGTFYRAPAPDAQPYVEVNQVVKKGQVLCIIEAMKLMNEIESEFDGKIGEVLVESGQPVEYNQPLFKIEPA